MHNNRTRPRPRWVLGVLLLPLLPFCERASGFNLGLSSYELQRSTVVGSRGEGSSGGNANANASSNQKVSVLDADVDVDRGTGTGTGTGRGTGRGGQANAIRRRQRREERVRRQLDRQRRRQIRRAAGLRARQRDQQRHPGLNPARNWPPVFNRRLQGIVTLDEATNDAVCRDRGRGRGRGRSSGSADGERGRGPDEHEHEHEDETVLDHFASSLMSTGLSASKLGAGTRETVLDTASASSADDNERRRVSFFASQDLVRTIKLDTHTRQLLTPYMTQPVEKYSLLSFHDEGEGEGEEEEEGDHLPLPSSTSLKARRWLVRRLRKEEAEFYRDEGTPGDGSATEVPFDPDNFFRLAIPLMPLVGIDLTPVIDLEVSVLANSTAESVGDDSEDDDSDKGTTSRASGRNRRTWIPGRWRRIQPEEAIKVRSVRIALLSTDEEVLTAMNDQSAVSDNARDSVAKIGHEAIGMVGQLEQWLKPHLSFDSTVGWSDATHDADELPYFKVSASATTSITIPDLPIPLPSRVIVRRVGHVITKRILSIALPHFLRQLEKDFRRWSLVDATNATSTSTSSPAASSSHDA